MSNPTYQLEYAMTSLTCRVRLAPSSASAPAAIGEQGADDAPLEPGAAGMGQLLQAGRSTGDIRGALRTPYPLRSY